MNIKSQSKKSNHHSTSTRQARRKRGRLLYRQGITADELDRLVTRWHNQNGDGK
jgi:hypothetical protein